MRRIVAADHQLAGARSCTGRALRAVPPSALTRIRILQISTTLTVGAKIHEYCELFMIIVLLFALNHPTPARPNIAKPLPQSPHPAPPQPPVASLLLQRGERLQLRDLRLPF